MQELAHGWEVEVDRGPDWLFLKVRPPAGNQYDTPQLAERLWNILQQHFIYRVVLELEQVPLLHSYLLGQLVLLSKRIHKHGGVMRVCGLSDQNAQALRACRLENCFPYFHNREEAVMGQGHRPLQPR